MIKIHLPQRRIPEYLLGRWPYRSHATGSTGYSLLQRPRGFPDSGSLVITPVSPHNLNIRPIVVPDDNIVSFEVEGRTDGFVHARQPPGGGSEGDTTGGARRIFGEPRAPQRKQLLQTLRNKLSWGLDKRN